MIKFLEVKRAYYADPENVVVEYKCTHGIGWIACHAEPDWTAQMYRIRPRTIRIGEIDVPEPVRECPPLGVKYYYPTINYSQTYDAFTWQGDGFDKRLLERGLIHLTREAAEQHAKALIIVSGGKIDD